MARKYRVTVTGAGTSGSFELFCAHQDGGPVWSTGCVPVSAGPVILLNALMPGMDARVEMGSVEHGPGYSKLSLAEDLVGPKAWDVTLEGSLYAGIGHQNGGDRLIGMVSPGLIVVDLGHVDDRSKGAGIETPATARAVN